MARLPQEENQIPLQVRLAVLEKHNITKKPDMPWNAFLVELLRMASTLEHTLMVEYLFAAYTLGGPQVPEQYRDSIREWQEILLTIAREEMGHLITVLNVLTFLGAEVDFANSEFEWNLAYFNFEPVSLKSLACYTYVEMNEKDVFPEKDEITKLAREHSRVPPDKLIPVEEVYSAIIHLLGDQGKIPESALNPDTYLAQATWDEWGRDYQAPPRSLDAEGNLQRPLPPLLPNRAILLINNVATRTEAIEALKAVSLQGEGPLIKPLRRSKRPPDSEGYTGEGQDPREPSHFSRFINMYKKLKEIKDDSWTPSRPVAVNPTTDKPCDDKPSDEKPCDDKVPCKTRISNYISAKHSRDWANLFNLRYRMLLNCLTHVFRLARVTRSDEPSVRAVMMHRVFAEMYNLKTISNILVQMPLSDDSNDKRRAGPPFQLPKAHSLRVTDAACWALDIDMLKTSEGLCHEILEKEKLTPNRNYLLTLLDLDKQRIEQFEQLLAGTGVY